MARILIIEDDPGIRSVVERSLVAAGHRVTPVADGQAGWETACEGGFGLIILDVRLPGLGGLEICRRLRAAGDPVPILMVTAQDSVAARVEGLEIGADDYLVKPFDHAELMARVGAQLRREGLRRSRTVEAGRISLDSGDRLAQIDGTTLNLTPKEYGLLEALVLNEGRVLGRDLLLERVWGHDEVVQNVVDVHLGSLRKKLDEAGAPGVIRTVRGLGFSFRRDGESD